MLNILKRVVGVVAVLVVGAAGCSSPSTEPWTIQESLEIENQTLALLTQHTRINRGSQTGVFAAYDSLKYDLTQVAKSLDPNMNAYGFSMLDLNFSADGSTSCRRGSSDPACYVATMGRRACEGFEEVNFKSRRGYDEDGFRMVVYVNGPNADIRRDFLMAAQARYLRRPAVLDCNIEADERETPQGIIRWKICFPKSDEDRELTAVDLENASTSGFTSFVTLPNFDLKRAIAREACSG